jgi:4'-phosphopantetheinyl transferase
MASIIKEFRGDLSIDLTSLTKKRLPFTLRRQLTHLIVLSLRPDIKDLQIRHAVSGRPYLHSSISTTELPLISISHSGAWIGVILSDTTTYATLDVEDMSLLRSYARLSNNFFSETEKDVVVRQGGVGFFKIWTAKEAIAKFHGEGINVALKVNIGHALYNTPLKQPLRVSVGGREYTLIQDILADHLFYTVCQSA